MVTLQDFLPVRCITGKLSWLVTQGDTLTDEDSLPVRYHRWLSCLWYMVTHCKIPYLLDVSQVSCLDW